MGKQGKLIARMRNNPADIRFDELKRLCDALFGEPRPTRGSHRVYATPWRGDPRVLIQEGRNGKAKEYQVKQVLAAIDRMEGE